jgi:hypothetical protein
MIENKDCPNFRDHLHNAIDRMFPEGHINSFTLSECWNDIHFDAVEEYYNCEGH